MEEKRITSSIRPLAVLYLGDGTYYYNYDIRESTRLTLDENMEKIEETQYDFIQVMLRGLANYSDCVQAIIRQYVTQNEEFDFVNSYNQYMLGLTQDKQVEEDYKQYLNLLNTIKTNVKRDFNL